MHSATELLEQMISIPSVNPLLAGSAAAAGQEVGDERRLAACVASYLRSCGAEVELQEVADGRCNVIGHLACRGNANDAVVLLTAHMDTYPANGPRSGYQPVREGNTLYGRGSADAKGALAAMLTAFGAAARAPVRREAYLVATVDEECLLSGARKLGSHHMCPALAITGEPTSLVPVVAQKGIVRGSFRVHGPASHAAYPASETAIGSAARLIDAVCQLNSDYADAFLESPLGTPTISITKVGSDGGMNVVAREVTLGYDARFLPGTDGEEFAREIRRKLHGLLREEVDFTMDALAFVSPPNEIPQGSPVVAEFFAAVAAETGSCVPDRFA